MKLKTTCMAILSRTMLTLGILSMLALTMFAATQPASAAATQNDAFVRVVHASPAAGTVDVYVDGAKLLSNFTFGTVTGYVTVPAGPHKIQVAPAGKGIGASVITQTVSVAAGVPYTIAAVGTASTGFSLAAFADDNLLSGSMASVRVYHLSPDAGPVNVAAGNSTVISGLTYENGSSYLNVPAGSYTFNVTVVNTGTKVPLPETLSSGMVYSVFAIGLLKGTPAIAFKVAAVAGVPGMPNTGSDPNAVVAPSSPFNPWLLAIFTTVSLLLVGSGVALRRYAIVRRTK